MLLLLLAILPSLNLNLQAQVAFTAARQAAPAASGGGGACDSLNDVNLIAYYRADSNLNDTKNSNHLTDHGTVTYAGGVIGNGFSFNGGNYADTSSGAIPQGDNDMSVSFTFKTSDNTRVQSMISKANDWNVYASSSVLNFQTAGGENLVSSVSIANDTFYHCVITFRASDNRKTITVNGTTDTVSGAAAPLSTSSALTIGSYGATVLPFLGVVDEIAVFDKVLSAQEISDLNGCRPSGN
jgi:hypothetical protein